MHLNLAKCSFGVQTSNFMGFMLTISGIEENPNKFQAIINIGNLYSITKMQQLNGLLVALT